MISPPPWLYRGFEKFSDEDAWLFAVLKPQPAFTNKDPVWSPVVERQAAEHAFKVDKHGKHGKPHNHDEPYQQILTNLEGASSLLIGSRSRCSMQPSHNVDYGDFFPDRILQRLEPR